MDTPISWLLVSGKLMLFQYWELPSVVIMSVRNNAINIELMLELGLIGCPAKESKPNIDGERDVSLLPAKRLF